MRNNSGYSKSLRLSESPHRSVTTQPTNLFQTISTLSQVQQSISTENLAPQEGDLHTGQGGASTEEGDLRTEESGLPTKESDIRTGESGVPTGGNDESNEENSFNDNDYDGKKLIYLLQFYKKKLTKKIFLDGATTQCKYVYTYKPKQYKIYKSKNYDMTSEFNDKFTRYQEIDDENVCIIVYI